MGEDKSGIFALYRIKKTKKKSIVSQWNGTEQFDGLSGTLKIKKNGKHKFLINNDDHLSERVDVETWKSNRLWKKMRKTSEQSGVIFFDSKTDILTVAESNCMWSSEWNLPLILKDQSFLETVMNSEIIE